MVTFFLFFGAESISSLRDQCLTNVCNMLMFINANPDAYLDYVGWSAGGFDTKYNLTETPFGSAGNFTDQPIVKQCIVGMRTGGGIASKKRKHSDAKGT